MSKSDDSPTDMTNQELSDSEVESLLAGTRTPAGFETVARELSALRRLGSQPHDVAISARLAEFVTQPPPTPAAGAPVLTPVAAAVSPTPPRKQRMIAALIGTTAAKFALAGGVAVAGVTGAHAIGLVDVPLLPSQGDPIEFVSASQSLEGEGTPENPAPPAAIADPAEDPDSDSDSDPAEDFEVDGTINVEVGGAKFSITIDGSGEGDLSFNVEVEGVSPACKAALEALGDLTNAAALEAAGQGIEGACAEDFGDFSPGLGDLNLERFRDQFGDGFPSAGELDDLLSELDLGGLEGLLEGQDFSQFEDLLREFDLESLDLGDLGDFESFFEGQDFADIEDALKDLGLGDFEGLLRELLPQLEGN